jgi:hypothetical protein
VSREETPYLILSFIQNCLLYLKAASIDRGTEDSNADTTGRPLLLSCSIRNLRAAVNPHASDTVRRLTPNHP